tara:strand:- start:270 stop:1145 length:876 start_codon:yes stop_codon:yes gene_type:complete
MTAFYNEIDPFAAQWLRNLIDAGHIAPGVVDERSIWDIAPEELDGFTQCHFFAGIGVWSHALRSAGWPDDRPVWTASCPCQPFSSAGKGAGLADERHAWPAVLWLAQARHPRTIFGEQVSSKDGLGWFDIVQADMDREGYTVSGLDTCAAGVGAPHIRQRLYFVADADSARSQGHREGFGPQASSPEEQAGRAGSVGDSNDVGNAEEREVPKGERHPARGSGEVLSFWSDAQWVYCDDPNGPRWRPIEPGTFPLADGTPARVGRLRAYGNALCAPQAEAFVRARMDLEVTA